MLAVYVHLKKAFDSVHLIFAESLEVLVMALEALHEEAKPLGLEVSWLKTKVQVFGDLLDEAVQSSPPTSVVLRTNIGDLTHNCVLRHSADVVVVTETWLNNEVEPTFGKIRGYTQWTRRDRPERAGDGVAVCFKEGVQAQHLDVGPASPYGGEFFRVVLADRSAILLCAMYRPPRQGPASLQYLTGALDDLMLEHRCRHVLVVGDLNHHLEQYAYENLLILHSLTDHVDIGVARDEATSRTVWLWDKADWASLCRDLSHTAWGTMLRDGADDMSRALTSRLLALQKRHVPHRDFTTKPADQPWFGYRCHVAAEAKYSAWLRYKLNPTRRNKDLHRAACRRMVVSSKWAMAKWK
ncbi:hypothetical protein GWK47_021822 [Chionoecetes opilio]|uniref:Endonuclease/exonuclease/phosphatase domain-containing protein n=1 Tax=Chionoecetes opilio TaxID=41210 RepID=A0A8J4XNV4_CHIOP|nr:hypothetical protein GWK47_021822 [Chionoecetes opilio]